MVRTIGRGLSVADTDPAYELSPRGMTLLQERLSTYFLVLGGIALGYWPSFYWIWGADPSLSRARVLAHILAPATFALLLLYAALWLVCRLRPWPKAWQAPFDVLASPAIGLIFAQIMLSHPSPVISVLEGLLALTAVLAVRALLVPSSGVRTALAGTLMCLGPGSAVLFEREHFATSWMGFRTLGPLFINWALIAIVLSTVASVVLYGLRREVHDARRLGQYTLTEKLGEGGMGVVYRARHALLRRPTAIKLLPNDTKHRGSLERFEREVQLMAELTHPNTVAIHDYGRTDEGVFYYVMEHLDGVDLQGLVAIGGPQPDARVVHIVSQVCGSLEEAHRRGLIHRDVKPANLFLCRGRSEPDTMKVLDFGLVKDTADPGDPKLSAADGVVGTPLYMAPECLLHPGSVDARSDLYSLGAVAYFLLTGTPVFSGGSLVEVCTRHLHGTPESPSARLGKPVAADLEALVLACLSKAPESRPAGAEALAQALRACRLTGSWGPQDARRWWTEHASRVDAHREARSRGSRTMASLVVAPTRGAWLQGSG